jgi:hypothetical protein
VKQGILANRAEEKKTTHISISGATIYAPLHQTQIKPAAQNQG